jgi:Rrf2 family protein
MHIKSGVEKAVYAVLILSLLPEKTSISSESLGQRMDVSLTYLQKLLRKLVQANLIHSVPGANGGFVLLKHPEEISVFDIYLAIEGGQSMYTSHGIISDAFPNVQQEQKCYLNGLMEQAELAWQNVLKNETMATLSQKLQSNFGNCISEYSKK